MLMNVVKGNMSLQEHVTCQEGAVQQLVANQIIDTDLNAKPT